MIVVVAITIALGAVLLWALCSEQVPPPARRLVRHWTGVPDPADIRRTDFPLTVAGYDPRAVDAHLRAVADAVAQMRDQPKWGQGDGEQIEGGQVSGDRAEGAPGPARGWSMAATPAAPAAPPTAPAAPPTAEGSPWAPPHLRKAPPERTAPAADEEQWSSPDDV